jgi:anti-anti-sigma factor
MAALSVSASAGADGPVVVLSGEADPTTATVLREMLAAQLETGARLVTVDASGLSFLDSASVRVLVLAARALQGRHGRLVLARPRPIVARLLEITGADRLLDVRELAGPGEPDEALGAVRDGRADLALVYHFHTAAPPRGWPATAGPGTYVPLVADPLRLLVPAGHPLAGRPTASLAEVAGERWIHGWGDVGDATDMLAALSGFRPQVACRSSDYRFMSALVGAGVGVALVPSLALTGSSQVRALQITPQLIRYIGAWLPRRHQPNPAAEQLVPALRAHALAKPKTQT